MEKLYVIQKYVVAKSIQEAARIEKYIPADEIWLDNEWKNAYKPSLTKQSTGFKGRIINNKIQNNMKKVVKKPAPKKK